MPGTRTFDGLLERCGVQARTLKREEREALDGRGFVLLLGALDGAALEPMRCAFDELAATPADSGKGGARESGTRHVAVLEHPAFDPLLVHPRWLAAVRHVLRAPFRVAQLGGREPLRGFGLQGLHTDWPPMPPGMPPQVVTTLWMLDDFTAENGATRLVPGSHRIPRGVPKSFAAPERHHPDEEPALAPAGTALVFSGHLWHSGTRNVAGTRRRAVQVTCVLRGLRGSTGMGAERPRAPSRLDERARALLGEEGA